MYVIMPITVDVTAGAEPCRFVFAKQGDNGIRVLRVTLNNGGRRLEIPEGIQPVLQIQEVDGTLVTLSGVSSGQWADFVLTSHALAAEGELQLEVQLLEGETVVTSGRFQIVVDPQLVSNEEIQASAAYNALAEALVQAETATAEAKAAKQAVVDAQSALIHAIERTQGVIQNANDAAERLYEIADEVGAALTRIEMELDRYVLRTELTPLDQRLTETSGSIQALEGEVNQKVDAEEGKGLSSNDFTDVYKQKLEQLVEAMKARFGEHIFD